MVTLKQALRSTLAHRILAWCGVQYVRAVWRLGRCTLRNGETLDALVAAGRPFIVCYWHSRITLFPLFWRYPVKMHLLISRHRDGQLVARAGAYYNLETIAGSSSKGGSQALRAMVRALKAGECVAITPDGPRGPRMRASAGAIYTARMAGVPIVPVALSASRRKVFNSWDRPVMPLPFTDFSFAVGDPISIEADADDAQIETARRLLEERLNDMTREIEEGWGLQPVEPAPPARDGNAMEMAGKG